MDGAAFQVVLEDALEKVTGVLGSKAAEYATNDRLHNFKKSAALQDTTPIYALAGMLAKHTVSVYDYMAKFDGKNLTLAQWDEKIIDHINYLVLLRALVVEKLGEETQ